VLTTFVTLAVGLQPLFFAR